MTYAVEDGGGRVLGSGKDLAALRQSLGGHLQNRVSRAGRALERAGLTSWTIGELPRTFASRTGGHEVVGYPALVDEGESVAVRVLAHESEAVAAHRRGVRRLLVLGTTPPERDGAAPQTGSGSVGAVRPRDQPSCWPSSMTSAEIGANSPVRASRSTLASSALARRRAHILSRSA